VSDHIYAPHPWDAIPAAPPRPGRDYADALDPLPIADALRAAELLRDEDEARDEAQAAEERADGYHDDARAILNGPLAAYPALVKAIEDDPYALDNGDDVRKAMSARVPS
jgi:hypothetical protein